MQGRTHSSTWSVQDQGNNFYYAERIVNGVHETFERKAHCLQCFKSDIIAERGGKVDLRGSHFTLCGGFLRAMALGNEDE